MTKSHATSSSNDHVRRKAVGVTEFATGKKGVTRAIHEFKVRKQRKVTEKATLLRKYHKVMQKEGYEAGARRRTRRPPDNPTSSDTRKDETEAEPKPRKPKSNPFAKSLLRREKLKEQQQQEMQERQAREALKEEQRKKRKERAKLLSKRTKKGQPVMKNVITDILDKLQKGNS